MSLIKYTCCCLTSAEVSNRSTEMTVLTTASVVTTYSSRISSVRGGIKVGRDFKYYLS
jgi:hypothetical protein